MDELSTSDSESNTGPERYPKGLWFEDGTIVIQAENWLFRGYKEILSLHSPIFAEMLSQSSLITKKYEGCNLVMLHDDSADDVFHFWSALHDTRFSFNELEPPAKAVALIGILRLSTKYKVPHLRSRGIAQLSQIYPSTLDAYESSGQHWERSLRKGDDMLMLNLARDVDIPSILPAVMYRCCSDYTPKDISFGYVWDTGHPDISTDVIASPEDQSICLEARETLFTAQISDIYSFARHKRVFLPCEDANRCTAQKYSYLTKIFNSSTEQNRLRCVPLQRLDFDEYEAAVCPPCFEYAHTKFVEARQDLWDKLPSFFKLPPWEKLLANADVKMEED